MSRTVLVLVVLGAAPAMAQSSPGFVGVIGSFGVEMNDVNDHGEVVGQYVYSPNDIDGDPPKPIVLRPKDGSYRTGDGTGFLSQYADVESLPGLTPEGEGAALAISNTGIVGGWARDAAGRVKAVVWQGGAPITLPSPWAGIGYYTVPAGVTEDGVSLCDIWAHAGAGGHVTAVADDGTLIADLLPHPPPGTTEPLAERTVCPSGVPSRSKDFLWKAGVYTQPADFTVNGASLAADGTALGGSPDASSMHRPALHRGGVTTVISPDGRVRVRGWDGSAASGYRTDTVGNLYSWSGGPSQITGQLRDEVGPIGDGCSQRDERTLVLRVGEGGGALAGWTRWDGNLLGQPYIFLPEAREGLAAGGYCVHVVTANAYKINARLQVIVSNPYSTFGNRLLQPESLVLPDPPEHQPVLTAADFEDSTFVSDPVSALTGELYLPSVTDLRLGGPMPLVLSRRYSSGLRRRPPETVLGPGWRHSFESHIEDETDAATVILPSGRRVPFAYDGTDYTQSDGGVVRYQLVGDPGAARQLYDPSNELVYTYDAAGNLSVIENRDGDQHLLTYDADTGWLSEVTDGLGPTLTFDYDLEGQLLSVTDGTRVVSYAHEGYKLVAVTDVRGFTTTMTYAENAVPGLLVAMTRPLGNTHWVQTYDDRGRVIEQTDPWGRATLFDFDDDTRTTVVTYPDDVIEIHVHDDRGRVVSVDVEGAQYAFDFTDGDRAVTSPDMTTRTVERHPATGDVLAVTGDVPGVAHTYTERTVGELVWYDLASTTWPDARVTTYTRDAEGRLASMTDPVGQVWTYERDAEGRVVAVEQPGGGRATFTYNARDEVVARTSPGAGETTFEYDDFGRRTRTVMPDGAEMVQRYDDAGHLVELVDERGESWRYVWDANDNLVQTVDPEDGVATTTYDAMDRRVRYVDPSGVATEYLWDERGRLAGAVDARGNTTSVEYDARGVEVAWVDAVGETWSKTVDAYGRETSSTTPTGLTMTTTRDVYGRVASVTAPSGASWEWSWSATGVLQSSTDPLGRVSTLESDAAGRPTRATMPGGVSATYEWGVFGGLTRVTDPDGHVWEKQRGEHGLATTVTDPLGRVETVEHDERLQLSRATLQDGVVLDVEWEALGLPARMSWSDGTEKTFTYDRSGRPLSSTGITQTYDAAGRMTTTNGIGVTWDEVGELETLTLGVGRAVRYEYDAAGRVTSVADWLGGTTTLERDADGRVTRMVHANGVATSWGRDVDGRVISKREDRDGGELASIEVTRNAASEVTARAERGHLAPRLTSRTVTRRYDAAGQSEQLTWDAGGRVVEDASGRSLAWNGASELLSIDDGRGTTAFTYDATGRVLSRDDGLGEDGFVWNYALGTPAVSVITRNGAGALWLVHTPDGNLLYTIDADGNRRHFHYDLLGNTRLVTDDDGEVVARFAYAPYGGPAGHEGESSRFTFGGRFGALEERPGLYRLGVRLYDANERRFLSRDQKAVALRPIDANPYLYAAGNPVLYVDPHGYEEQKSDDGWVPKWIKEQFNSGAAGFLLNGDSTKVAGVRIDLFDIRDATDKEVPGALSRYDGWLTSKENEAAARAAKLGAYSRPGDLQKASYYWRGAEHWGKKVGKRLDQYNTGMDVWSAGNDLYDLGRQLQAEHAAFKSEMSQQALAQINFHGQAIRSLQNKEMGLDQVEKLTKAYDENHFEMLKTLEENARTQTYLTTAKGVNKVAKGMTPAPAQWAISGLEAATGADR